MEGQYLAGVIHLLKHLPDQLGWHEVILCCQNKHAGRWQLLGPQALPVPDKLPAEGLQSQPDSFSLILT